MYPQPSYESILNPTDRSNVANGTSGKQFFLDKIWIQEAVGYRDHYNHHYVPNAISDSSVSNLVDDVVRHAGVPSQASLAVHASELFSMNMGSNPQDRLYIPNGWSEKRLRFLMKVREVDTSFNKESITFINGFTDHFGISSLTSQFHLDPKMTFYINSLVTVRQEQHQTPTGPQYYWNVDQAAQVINGRLVGVDPVTSAMTNVHLLRPSDVIMHYSQRQDEDLGMGSWLKIDGRSSTANGAISHFNNMGNNLSSTYLSRILDPVLAGFSQHGSRPGIGGLDSAMLSLAQRDEFNLQHSAFLRFMARHTGTPLTTNFTMGQMETLDPTISQRVVYIPLDPRSIQTTSSMNMDTQGWNYQGYETQIASKLVSIIPSLFWENFATSGSFSLTNRTPNHLPTIAWQYLQFIAPTGLPSFHQKLENQLLTSVLTDITKNNLITVNLDIFVDTSSDIRLTIQVENNPPMGFASPAFGSGLFAPVFTSNEAVVNGITQGFTYLFDGLQTIRAESLQRQKAANTINFNAI